MHTEEQAKELWCPHVQFHAISPNLGSIRSANRWKTASDFHENPTQSRCIGSKCSQWRWCHKSETFYTQEGEKVCAKGTGYCGLAGKP